MLSSSFANKSVNFKLLMKGTEVYMWGDNSKGQLGVGDTIEEEYVEIPRLFCFNT